VDTRNRYQRFLDFTSDTLFGRIQQWLLHSGSEALECVGIMPPIRLVLDCKVLQAYFHQIHDIPESFSFAKYVDQSLQVSKLIII
jgi:hypothetical protein